MNKEPVKRVAETLSQSEKNFAIVALVVIAIAAIVTLWIIWG